MLATSSQDSTRPTTLATLSAVLSCIGLWFGNLLGLALAAGANHQMDRMRGEPPGRRLVLVGWLVGVVGLICFPLAITLVQTAPAADTVAMEPAAPGTFTLTVPRAVTVAIMFLVLFPAFLLLYGLQDWLPPPRNQYGYRCLGPHRRKTAFDRFASVAGILLGVALCFIGMNDFIVSGLAFVLVSVGLLLGRRSARAVWLFFLLAIVVQVLVLQIA